MGIVASYYVVDESIIDKVTRLDIDIEEFVRDDQSDIKNAVNRHESEAIFFGHGLKSWNPMYELLKMIDASETKVLSLLFDKQFYHKETENNYGFYCYQADVVKEIWQELRNISIGDVEIALDNKHIIETISAKKGYRNENITNKDSICSEFFELYKAFYLAQQFNKGVITSLG